MYDKVPTDLKFVEREKEVEKFWEDEHIFEKSIKMREGCQPYVFYDGPPTANGKPHIGHVETRVIKDMIPRFRAMKGYMVPRLPRLFHSMSMFIQMSPGKWMAF